MVESFFGKVIGVLMVAAPVGAVMYFKWNSDGPGPAGGGEERGMTNAAHAFRVICQCRDGRWVVRDLVAASATAAFEAAEAIRNGADEVDMVVNLAMVKDGC